MGEKVLIDITNRIGTVIVNNPKKQNAMDKETLELLSDKPDAVGDNDDVRVVIFRAAGQPYITGSDLETFAEFDQIDALEHLKLHAQGLYNEVANLSKPTIAAIDGDAFGGGLKM